MPVTVTCGRRLTETEVRSADLLEALGEGVQSPGSLLRDQEQLSGLDTGAPVAGNDVGLYDQGHPGRQGEVGCGGRPGAGTTGGR